MPIYAYKCSSCGFAKDVLQKISDEPLTQCPTCLAASFSKQVTAAGFQLKGSGWYVTDFRGGNTAAAPEAGGSKSDTSTPIAADSTASTSPSSAGVKESPSHAEGAPPKVAPVATKKEAAGVLSTGSNA